MMGPGANLNYSTAAAYQQMLTMAGYTAAQQAALNPTRNPYTPATFAGYYLVYLLNYIIKRESVRYTNLNFHFLPIFYGTYIEIPNKLRH